MLALLLLIQSTDIVITGKKLAEAQQLCVRGGCTPLRDAQASIALAEEQFRDGDYLKARDTLAAAAARNRGAAATDPKPVAAIYEAYATVELHEGDRDRYRRAVANRVETLRDNLPPGDPAVVAATAALGDMWVNLDNYRQAQSSYRAAERTALAAGQDRAALIAGLKRVALTAVRDRRAAVEALDEIAARPIAQQGAYRTAIAVMRLRIAARNADDAAITRLVTEVGHGQGKVPALIYAPPYELDARAAANREARKFDLVPAIQVAASEQSGIHWADIGFWIRPDGRTGEVEILRSNSPAAWSAAAVAQIGARRYTATRATAALVDAASSDPVDGIYRVERFTGRSVYATPTGSHVRRRIAIGGYEVLDLTNAPARPPS